MKYNPVTGTIDRPDGTPYLHLAPGIGSPEAYAIADILLHAPEWEQFRERLEAQVAGLEQDLKTIGDQSEELRAERNSAESHAEKLEDELDTSRMMIEELETELTQARLRIEELEAMLESAEAALENTQPQP